MGSEFQFGKMKTILEIEGDDGGTKNVKVLSETELYTGNG
jgi:hypothetical protein